jgi:hypothetical protein
MRALNVSCRREAEAAVEILATVKASVPLSGQRRVVASVRLTLVKSEGEVSQGSRTDPR